MKIGKYELNNIYCEDSYKAIKELPNKCIDCIYTDIPYLMESGGKSDSPLNQRISKKMFSDIEEIRKGIDYSIFDEFVRVVKNINIFIWCSKLQILDIMNFFVGKHDCSFEMIVWCKDNPTPQTNNTWLPDVEYCLYFREKGKIKLNDGYDLKRKWYSSPINKKDKDLFQHPTIKPLEFVKKHILHTTQENDIVADFFMGGGYNCYRL